MARRADGMTWSVWNLYVMCLKNQARYWIGGGKVYVSWPPHNRPTSSAYQYEELGEYIVEHR
jgi:hypothetical protein